MPSTNREHISRLELRKRIASALAASFKPFKKMPVGIFLSGGFDSTLLCWLAKEAGQVFVAYTVDMAGYNRDIVRASKQVAKKLGIRHIVLSVTLKEYLQWVPLVLSLRQGGDIDFDLPAVAAALRKVSSEHQVIFSGFGCDEMWGERLNDFDSRETARQYINVHCQEHRRLARGWKMKFVFPYAHPRMMSLASLISEQDRKRKRFLRQILQPSRVSESGQIPPLAMRAVRRMMRQVSTAFGEK
jgi:asparagine synthetase B (glutamine-hydrolysing)